MANEKRKKFVTVCNCLSKQIDAQTRRLPNVPNNASKIKNKIGQFKSLLNQDETSSSVWFSCAMGNEDVNLFLSILDLSSSTRINEETEKQRKKGMTSMKATLMTWDMRSRSLFYLRKKRRRKEVALHIDGVYSKRKRLRSCWDEPRRRYSRRFSSSLTVEYKWKCSMDVWWE